MNSPCELADVVRLFGNELSEKEKLKPLQIKVMYKILQCRTAVLGGHKEVCDCCGSVLYRYNSCGDRHCPQMSGC
ncbi:MAG: transposase zinc-binding domain-containing protein [Bacteroidales bacterium]|nr:transposase zinc-binding domain-containing protein [Bacteroidales bacterium]